MSSPLGAYSCGQFQDFAPRLLEVSSFILERIATLAGPRNSERISYDEQITFAASDASGAQVTLLAGCFWLDGSERLNLTPVGDS